MPYSDPEMKRIRQAEAARRRRAERNARDDGTTRDDAGRRVAPEAVKPAAAGIENPIARARKRLGLSRVELAALCGASYGCVVAAEVGYRVRVPGRILDALAELGEDTGQIEDDYLLWREALTEALRQNFLRGNGHD